METTTMGLGLQGLRLKGLEFRIQGLGWRLEVRMGWYLRFRV